MFAIKDTPKFAMQAICLFNGMSKMVSCISDDVDEAFHRDTNVKILRHSHYLIATAI